MLILFPTVISPKVSVLAIVMNTRVKLIYRPASIKDGRQGAEKQLILEQRGNETLLKNPTPYYMAVIGMKVDGKKVILSDKVLADVAQLSPFSECLWVKKLAVRPPWMPSMTGVGLRSSPFANQVKFRTAINISSWF